MTTVSGVYGGGAIYQDGKTTIPQLAASGFTEVVVWNIAVNDHGDLSFNYTFQLVSDGVYTGGDTHPDFAKDMTRLKQTPSSVTRLTFSIGSSNVGAFQAIQKLVAKQGTGPDSILYKNFQALKDAIPALDTIDFDDENCYDAHSMVQFAVMLGELGLEVSLCPYTNASFWTSVAQRVNTERSGTVTAVHLQCYSGGAGNSPCSARWDFGDVPVFPGLSSSVDTPTEVRSKLSPWHAQCGISGGWMWIYDQFYQTPGATRAYATAINEALSGGS